MDQKFWVVSKSVGVGEKIYFLKVNNFFVFLMYKIFDTTVHLNSLFFFDSNHI